MIYPWLQTKWAGIAGRLERLPHALLLCGPAGGGKLEFGLALAQRLLCSKALGAQPGCGRCSACNWFERDNHPDFRRVVPEVDESAVEPDGAESTVDASTRRAPSRQIRIEQVRALWEFAVVGGHAGGRKLVLIRPAEAMNAHTANALLKLLEEPPTALCFIMITNQPDRLLPTLRSRCQAIQFPRPDPITSREWLAGQGIERAEELLAVCGGMPLRAAEMAGSQRLEIWQALLGHLARGAELDPLSAAAQCEGWLRTRTNAAGIEMRQIVEWVAKWVTDVALASQGARPRFHPGFASHIGQLVANRPDSAWLRCYNDLRAFSRSAEHPLNPRLFLEDLFIRYCDAAGEAR